MKNESLNILVIGDDSVDRMNLRRALMKVGLLLEIQEAEDASSGLTALQSRYFDCPYLAGMMKKKALLREGLPSPPLPR